MKRKLILACWVCFLFISVHTVLQAQEQGSEYKPGELLVKYKASSSSAAKAEFYRNNWSINTIKTFGEIGVQHVKLPADMSVEEALEIYRNDPDVEYAEPNYIYHAEKVPNDTDYGKLWGLNNTGLNGGTNDADIDAPEAWDITTGSSNVIVAVIDTGVFYTHPDLEANIWTNTGEIAGNGIDDDGNGYIDDVRGWNFYSKNNDPIDEDGHGTHCAGIIAGVGNNAKGVTGVCWTAKIMPLRFLDQNGDGYTSDAVSAILYANRNGAHVINNSWGGYGFSQTLKDAIDASSAVVVCAAGNGGADNIGDNNDVTPVYPSSYESPNLISVAATDHNDTLRSSSNYGTVSVDLAAPGDNIYSTIPVVGYTNMSGTSMAAPYVSGTAALLKAYKPSLTNLGIKAAIESSVDTNPTLFGKLATGGRLNAHTALTKISSDQPAEITNPTNGSTLISTSVTFTWTNANAEKYRLEIGNSAGSSDLYGADQGTNTSVTVNGLPSDGRKLYVRLKSSFGGVWQQKDYTYTAYTSSGGGGQKAVMSSPTQGSTLTSTTVTFAWTAGDATSYRIDVGNSSGTSDIYAGTTVTSTSQTVSGLPNDARLLYVRLWSFVSGSWVYNDYTYTAASSGGGGGGDVRMISPVPSSTLPSTSVTFTWNGSGADRFWIYIGTSRAGSTDIYSKDQGTNTSVLIPGLPDNGIKLYVRLWWLSGGLWQYEDYTYTAFKSAGTKEPGVIITPAPGTTLTSTTVEFKWTGSASRYWLYIGTSEKGSDIYAKDQGTNTSVTVSALPGNGAKLYVRLWSLIDGYWQYYDCFYTAFSTPDSVKPGEMITPADGTTLTSTTVEFKWTGSASRYWLYIGTSSAGGTDIYAKDQGTNTSVTVSGLPNNGTKVYVRLWSLVSGKWVYKDYIYTAFKAPDSKVPAEILTPAPGTALTSTSQIFTWSSTGATKYWLYVGTSGVGTSNVYSADQGTNTSATVSNLPRNKVKVYVRLWSLVNGNWLYKDCTYTAAP